MRNMAISALIATILLYGAALPGTASETTKRDTVLVISDIHLGADDAYSEMVKNRPALVSFLKETRLRPDIAELVIAGDLFDEWFTPSDRDTYDGGTQIDFMHRIGKNNKNVVDALNEIIGDGKIKVVYVPGNHDLLVDSRSVQAVLPGISEARDVRGLGTYIPAILPEAAIEHGHRYNLFCAPDPLSNAKTAPNSILPPGYFFTRMATTSVVQGKPRTGLRPEPAPEPAKKSPLFLYRKVWEALFNELPTSDDYDKPTIRTNIDGFTETYSLKDLIPEVSGSELKKPRLFADMLERWRERSEANLVPVEIPIERALIGAASSDETDEQANIQYFLNPKSDKRIVVFGHTHAERLKAHTTHDGKKALYVNSGTWIDRNPDGETQTFVEIRKKDGEIGVYLFRYGDGGTTELLKSEKLTD